MANKITAFELRQLLWTDVGPDLIDTCIHEKKETNDFIVYRAASLRAQQTFSVMEANESDDGSLLIFFADAEYSPSPLMSIIRSAFSVIRKDVISQRFSLSEALNIISGAVHACGYHNCYRALIGVFNTNERTFSYRSYALGFYKYSPKKNRNVELIIDEQENRIETDTHGNYVLPIESEDILFFLPDSLIFMNRYFVVKRYSKVWQQLPGCNIINVCNAILNRDKNINLWPDDPCHPCPVVDYSKYHNFELDFFNYLFVAEILNGLFSKEVFFYQGITNIIMNTPGDEVDNNTYLRIEKKLKPFSNIVCTKTELEYAKTCSTIEKHMITTRSLGLGIEKASLRNLYSHGAILGTRIDIMAMAVQIK